jgi:hypothetical protein
MKTFAEYIIEKKDVAFKAPKPSAGMLKALGLPKAAPTIKKPMSKPKPKELKIKAPVNINSFKIPRVSALANQAVRAGFKALTPKKQKP